MKLTHATAVTTLVVLGAGCAARFQSHAVTPRRASVSQRVHLSRSLFARDPGGQLREGDLQRILAAPAELALPARVGIVPILTHTTWRGPSPRWRGIPQGSQLLAAKLRGSEHFPLVTEVLPIPSGALGMEALREIAARYQLRYLLLYRESFHRQTRVNAFALAYLTVVGAFFSPGRTLHVSGFVEASLFDAKTGLFRFTVRRAVEAIERANLWHGRYKLGRLERALARKAAPDLARDIRSAAARFLEAARAEAAHRRAATRSGPRSPGLGRGGQARSVGSPG